MAQVYFDKDSAPKTLGEADIRETSKVEEMPRSSSVSKHDQEAKNCEESSSKESNVIRVTANAASSEREDDVQDSVMDSEDDKNSANSSQHGNEHKSND
jgi:pyocin large subunit-like protein